MQITKRSLYDKYLKLNVYNRWKSLLKQSFEKTTFGNFFGLERVKIYYFSLLCIMVYDYLLLKLKSEVSETGVCCMSKFMPFHTTNPLKNCRTRNENTILIHL